MESHTDPVVRAGRPRAKWVAGVSMIVVAIVALATWAFLSPGALAYYASPSQVARQGPAAFGRTLRVGGRVAPGTLVRNGADISFVITDGTHRVPVVYRGDVPDTLKDNTDAIAQGRLASDGTLHATNVQAKCSSKFVPKNRPQDLGRS